MTTPGASPAGQLDSQFEDLLLGNALHGSPVDLAEGLDVREPCFAQPACGGAGFAGADLGIQQLAQVFLVGPGFSASLASELTVLTPQRRQLEGTPYSPDA